MLPRLLGPRSWRVVGRHRECVVPSPSRPRLLVMENDIEIHWISLSVSTADGSRRTTTRRPGSSLSGYEWIMLPFSAAARPRSGARRRQRKTFLISEPRRIWPRRDSRYLCLLCSCITFGYPSLRTRYVSVPSRPVEVVLRGN